MKMEPLDRFHKESIFENAGVKLYKSCVVVYRSMLSVQENPQS